MVWDLVGLTKMGVYSTPNEIKTIDLCNESLLVVGTQGTATTGALLIFDLSKKPLQPIDQKEFNSDIAALASSGKYIFMACRTQINAFDLSKWIPLPPLP